MTERTMRAPSNGSLPDLSAAMLASQRDQIMNPTVPFSHLAREECEKWRKERGYTGDMTSGQVDEYVRERHEQQEKKLRERREQLEKEQREREKAKEVWSRQFYSTPTTKKKKKNKARYVPTLEELTQDRLRFHRADQRARQESQREQLPPYNLRDMREEMNRLPARPVLPGVLTVGFHGLAGPAGAAKSLLARDWMDAVVNGLTWQRYTVTEPRGVIYVTGEGRDAIPERFKHVRMDHGRFMTADPINLTQETAVNQFLSEIREQDTGLIVFDHVGLMGISDEDKAQWVRPIINNCKRMADEIDGAVLMLGHCGHETGRRFRGSSAWRDNFDSEWHMADNKFTCEKMKDGDKAQFTTYYTVEYPYIKWLDNSMSALAMRQSADEKKIEEYLITNPSASVREIASEVLGDVGKKSYVGRLLPDIKRRLDLG
jgi:hypothetical protein